jgi:hypothetical protein
MSFLSRREILARSGFWTAAMAMGLAVGSAQPNRAIASEGGGSESAEPIVIMVQFVRTERGRLKIWALQFRINAENKESLTQISERQPRIVDGVLVRMTNGLAPDTRPTIDEVKQAITQSIEERLGSIVGLEITVMKLKQVG